jgi:RNA polymerase sigma-70 factor (ECF subfamily)
MVSLRKIQKSSRCANEECLELRAIVSRARSGDLSAQSALVNRFTTRIKAFVRPLVRDSGLVDDVTQIAMTKMVRRIGMLRDPATFESWLFTLARNVALDLHRRARCRPASALELHDLAQIPEDRERFTTPEIMDALNAALTRLSPTDQTIVRLIIQGSSYGAAAEQVGVSVGAVKLRLNRVRPFLRVSVGSAIGLHVREEKNFRAPPRSRMVA